MRLYEFDYTDPKEQKFTTAYHITLADDGKYIAQHGLKPAGGFAFLIVDEGDPKKLSDDIATVERWMSAKTEDVDEPLTMLKVDITGIPLAKQNGWPVATSTIPADRITDLGEHAITKLERYYSQLARQG